MVLLYLFIIACHNNYLQSHTDKKLQISYNKDTIVVIDDEYKFSLVPRNGEYYTLEGNIFLSNKKDTTYVDSKGVGLGTLVVIDGNFTEDVFTTSLYIINTKDSATLLSRYYYDRDYKIKTVELNTTIEYY